MALDKQQIKELLGQGLDHSVVANAVGCDPGYITHLMADEEFANAVAELKILNLHQHSKRDRNIDSIEDKLIQRLEEAVDTGQIYKPVDILRSFAVVNAAKRRGSPVEGAVTTKQTVINLQLPKIVVNNLSINAKGEVVEVGGQTLVTMPTNQLLRTLGSGNNGGKDGENKYDKVARYLPSTAAARLQPLLPEEK